MSEVPLQGTGTALEGTRNVSKVQVRNLDVASGEHIEEEIIEIFGQSKLIFLYVLIMYYY